MASRYRIDGFVVCRNDPALMDQVAKINKRAGRDVVTVSAPDYDGEAMVTLDGELDPSWETAREINKLVEALSPFALKPAPILAEMDGRDESVYVGPPDLREKTMSEHVLSELTQRYDLELLASADVMELIRSVEEQLEEDDALAIAYDLLTNVMYDRAEARKKTEESKPKE